LHDVSVQADLNSVVASRDSLEIPLTLLDADGALAVLNDRKEDQRAEDVDAGGKKSLLAFNLKLIVRDYAAVLEEDEVGLVQDAL